MQAWTKEEIEILYAEYSSIKDLLDLEKRLGRQRGAIVGKANTLGLVRNKKGYTLETLNTKIKGYYPHLEYLNFVNVNTLAEVRDNNCGHTWQAKPKHILDGACKTCPTCVPRKNLNRTTEEFLSDTLTKHLDSTITETGPYLGSSSVIKLKYACGHEDTVIADNLISKGTKKVCRVCVPQTTTRKDPKVFLEEFDAVVYEGVSLLDPYTTAKERLRVTHTCGEVWTISPDDLLSQRVGAACPKCHKTSGISLVEKTLRNFLEENYSGWIIYNDRTLLDGKELDIVLPDLGLAIEFNGDYWHSSEYKYPKYHYDKTVQLYNTTEFKLVHVFQSDWLNKQSIVKSMLLSKLGTTKKIMARKCVVRSIGFPSQFLTDNHIQGSGTPTQINYGLFHEGALVATMTFGTSRFNKDYQYELIRYCSTQGTTIVGGASKLFKAFVQEYNPTSVMSYSNFNFGRGNMYSKLGFKHERDTGPDYYYIKGRKKVSRYQAMKSNLTKLLGTDIDLNKTEQQLMLEAGYQKVYTAGSQVWGWK